MGHRARQKGPRRSHLKRFSSAMVNSGTGPTPNREILADLHHRAVSMGVGHFIDRDPAKMFSEEEKFEALWQGDWKQGLEHFNKIVLTVGKYGRINLYFRGQTWVFLREDEILKSVQRSITYSSRDRAMRAYNLGKITWVERAPIPELKEEVRDTQVVLSGFQKAPPG